MGYQMYVNLAGILSIMAAAVFQFLLASPRASGVALIILPMLAAFKSRGDVRLHFYNIKQAWIWMFDDFK